MISLSLRGSRRYKFSLVCFICFFALPVFAKTFEVPTSSYPTLSSALEEAFSNGESDVIYLIGDISENVVIDFTGDADAIVIEGKEGVFQIDGGGNDRVLKLNVRKGLFNLTLKNLKISKGFTQDKGGALLVNVSQGASVSFAAYNVVFESSTAESHGGGVALINYGRLDALFRRSIFKGNRSFSRGGAILLDGVNGTFENCLFAENSAEGGGGGIYVCNGSAILIESSTITNNSARKGVVKKDGGGLFISNLSTVELRNSILWGNDGSLTNRDFYISSDSSLEAHFSLLKGLSGEGCIEGDPAFSEGYTLSPGSPCIDTGDSRVYPKEDLCGALRPADGNNDGHALPDMGAFEAQLDMTPPSEVSNLSAEPSTRSVFLSWNIPPDLDFDLVKVYIGKDQEGLKLLSDTRAEAIEVHGLLPDTLYVFKLTTVDLFGNESEGSIIEVKTLSEGSGPNPPVEPDLTPPGEVLNLTAVPSTSAVTLMWITPKDIDLLGCRLYDEYHKVAEIIVSPSSSVSFVVSELSPDRLYRFRVTTFDKAGNESQGVWIEFRTLSLNHPPLIRELQVSPAFGGKGTVFKLLCIAEDPDGDKVSYDWDLDEEEVGVLFSYASEAYVIAHALPEDRLAHVKLRVTDSKGAFSEGELSFKVEAFRGKDDDGDGVENDSEGEWAFDPRFAYLKEKGILFKLSCGEFRNFSLKGENPYSVFLNVVNLTPGGDVTLGLDFFFPVSELELYLWRKESFKKDKVVDHSLALSDGGDYDLDGEVNGKIEVMFTLSFERAWFKGGCEVSSIFEVTGGSLMLMVMLLPLLRRNRF